MLFANITDMTVNIRFNLNNNIGTGEHSYALGDELFNFLSFDIAEVYALYIQVADAFMNFHYGAKDEKAYKEKLTALVGELDKRSIYLHPYTIDLLNSMEEVQKGWKYSLESYFLSRTVEMRKLFFGLELLLEDKTIKPYFPIDLLDNYHIDLSKVDMLARPSHAERELARQKSRNEKTKPLSKTAMKKAIALAILAIAEDLNSRRVLFLGDIDAITGGDTGGDPNLSLTQKLYLLDVYREAKMENPVYTGGALWNTSFAPYPQIPGELLVQDSFTDIDVNEVLKYMQENGVEIKQVHEITTMEGLIVFELLSLLDKGASIKKCRYCGSYFVPQGRSDTVFCDRIAKGETKPCRFIGSLKLHQAAKANNPIHEAHQKAYRRMNSKCRTKRITQSQFFAWSEEARAKRDACLNGEYPFADFMVWLDADKKPAPR